MRLSFIVGRHKPNNGKPTAMYLHKTARFAITTLSIVLMGGCASTATEFRAQPPRLTTETSKSAANVATCISQKWSARLNGLSMLPTSNGYSISFVSDGLIYYLVDIESEKHKTIVRFWTGTFTLESYIRDFSGDIQACM